MITLKKELITHAKRKPSSDALEFGKIFTDHMLLVSYDGEKGWHNPVIKPYQPIAIEPASSCLHYGQLVFEGMKAFRSSTGEVSIFRPTYHMERLNESSNRMCIPPVPQDDFLHYIKQLIKVDCDWVPNKEGTSLYIRPFILATEPTLAVKESETFLFMTILSPVGSYYKDGLKPIDIYVEDEYVRAVKGGTGMVKTAGNYAGAFKTQDKAIKNGYSQVLWLDAIEKKYVEEVGLMNVFFVLEDKIITPSLDGTILPGVTRNSTLTILKDKGYQIEERKITIDEIISYIKNGNLKEMFGTGTAAVICAIGSLTYKSEIHTINNREIGEVSLMIYNTITGIQTGMLEDRYAWNEPIE